MTWSGEDEDRRTMLAEEAATKHWADKPLLRDFFWFLVLPYRFKQWLKRGDDIGSK